MYANEGEVDSKEWAVIRDEQMKVFKTVKNTGIAVMIDGSEVGNIHPLDKKTVGHRLALQGLQVAYGLNNHADVPTLRDYGFDKNRIRLSFNNMEEKVVIKSADHNGGLIEGFEIAGENLEFIPA